MVKSRDLLWSNHTFLLLSSNRSKNYYYFKVAVDISYLNVGTF